VGILILSFSIIPEGVFDLEVWIGEKIDNAADDYEARCATLSGRHASGLTLYTPLDEISGAEGRL
jgi:hypothetical protein